MSDDLGVSGGGSIAVDTASMAHASGQLLDAAAALLRIRTGIAALPSALTPDVRALLDDAAAEAAAAAGSAHDAADGLRVAAERYGRAEALASALGTSAAAELAAIGGRILRGSIIAGPGGAALLVGGTVAVGLDVIVLRMAWQTAVTGRIERPWLDPVLLQAARLALASTDDGLRGLIGTETPAEVAHDRPAAPLGSEGIAAALAVAFGAVGHVRPGVRVRRVALLPVGPPASIGELADRVPEEHPGDAQIRIERYPDGEGRSRWIVYVTGTATFAPDSAGEPFDMTSNLEAAADETSASGTGVTTAMQDAGVTPGDRVLLVGHSQGALVATRIAATGRYRAAVVTLGGPTGQIPLPPEIPVLAVEHAEDPVPVLGGAPADGAAGRARVLVTRQLYGPGHPPDPADAVPSHALSEYASTLHLTERSTDPRVVAFRRRIAAFVSGPPGTASAWRAERVPAPTGRVRSAAAARARYPTRTDPG